MKHIIDINNNKVNCIIKIRLDDECKNGHADFAITADFWEVGKTRTDGNWRMSGCCHEEILQVKPSLRPFILLHLNDFKGAPMYAVGNGWYHAVKAEYHNENAGPEALANYFNIDIKAAEVLCKAEDKTHFHFLIEEMGLPSIWQAQANKAIKVLEEWTGQKFDGSIYQKSHFSPLDAEVKAELLAKLKSGYYDAEKVEQRKAEKQRADFAAKIAAIKADAQKEVDKIRREEAIKLAMCELFPDIKSNFIYYNHSNEIGFEFSSMGAKYSPEDRARALSVLEKIAPGIKEHINRK